MVYLSTVLLSRAVRLSRVIWTNVISLVEVIHVYLDGNDLAIVTTKTFIF